MHIHILNALVSDLTDAEIPPPPSGDPQPETVELATLGLPATALDRGLQAGEGNHVVLEASNETVEQIQAARQDASAEPPTISAVVDLEALAELAGATDQEFLTGLHQELQETRAAAAEEAADQNQNDAEGGEAGEGTRLLGSAGMDDEGPGVTEQILITLPADPFIETLAEALPVVPEDDESTLADSIWPGETLASGTAMAAASVLLTTDIGTLADGEEPEEQHYAHDAFLLDLPTTDDMGNTEHRYVLALPEIIIEPSLATDTSALSEDAAFPMMERAMSLLPTTTRLPTDIETVRLEATEHVPTKADPTQVHLDLVVERRVPAIGYVILFSGVFALASIGAALDLQLGGVSPPMKTAWRQIATCVVLVPMVIKSFNHDGVPDLTPRQWMLLPIASAAYTYMALAFVVALEMTSLANAFVLSNMTSLVIIAGRAVFGLPVLPLEGGGAITGFIGAAICAQGKSVIDGNFPEEEEEAIANNLAILGDLVAFSASFGTAVYLLIAKELRPKMDLFVFMFAIMGFGAVLLLAYMMLIGEEMSFDMHPVHGVFGWLNLEADRLPLELYMAIVCNCLGTTGYIAVMKYFDPIVPATVMLLEPVIGAILGTAAGTTSFPGLQTWLGNLVVAGGTFLVIFAGASSKESIDATEALRPGVGTALGGDDAASLVAPIVKTPFDAAGGTSSNAKVVWST